MALIEGTKGSHGFRPITLLAERRSAPCCRLDTSLLSAGDQGAEWRLAGKVVNTIGVIENTFGVFEISFGVLHFSGGKTQSLVVQKVEFSGSKLLARFPTAGGLLPKGRRFAYCSLVVCLLEAKSPPNRSECL